jgi:hypothetical protein
LYGCETWSLTLREEYRLRTFTNEVLRRIFGPKREKVAGGFRRMQHEKPYNLYVSLNIRVIKPGTIRWLGHAARMKEMKFIQNFGLKTRKKETTWET